MNKIRCPFCSGSKITPLIGNSSQDCKSCNKDGFVSKNQMIKWGLEDSISYYTESQGESRGMK